MQTGRMRRRFRRSHPARRHEHHLRSNWGRGRGGVLVWPPFDRSPQPAASARKIVLVGRMRRLLDCQLTLCVRPHRHTRRGAMGGIDPVWSGRFVLAEPLPKASLGRPTDPPLLRFCPLQHIPALAARPGATGIRAFPLRRLLSPLRVFALAYRAGVIRDGIDVSPVRAWPQIMHLRFSLVQALYCVYRASIARMFRYLLLPGFRESLAGGLWGPPGSAPGVCPTQFCSDRPGSGCSSHPSIPTCRYPTASTSAGFSPRE